MRIITATLVGLVAGLLLAPKSGKETIAKVREEWKKL